MSRPLVRVIPGQIILVKQVNFHLHSIEVRYLSLMSVVNPLHEIVSGRSKAVLLLWILFVI